MTTHPTKLLVVLGTLGAMVLTGITVAEAAEPNPDCTLTVPANPLTAAGLATPYKLSATDPGDGACTETSPDQAAFVEAAVLDPATGHIVGIYHPVVVNQGSTPALAPTPVTLPPDAVVGIWFGSNGDTLRLAGPGAAHANTGLRGSVYGQYSDINGAGFFRAAFQAVHNGQLAVPPLGTASDGKPCPTTRDFMVVDQDQSDNVATTYWLAAGKVTQNTAAARAMPGSAQVNGSDEALLAKRIDPALGCTPFTGPNLDDPGTQTTALALNELSAAVNQASPAALVPLNDPMTLVNDHYSARKTNLYRAGVGMPPLPAGQNPRQYCRDIQQIGGPRVEANKVALAAKPSPDAGVTLYDFLKSRMASSMGELGCSVTPVTPQHRPLRGHRHRGRDD